MKILVPAGPWHSRCTVEVEFRCDPIPGTRCRRGAGYGKTVLRRPRTTQERRNYFLDEEMEDVKLRARRSGRNLPNAWDDYCRSDIFVKNWKKFRRTQYKTP